MLFLTRYVILSFLKKLTFSVINHDCQDIYSLQSRPCPVSLCMIGNTSCPLCNYASRGNKCFSIRLAITNAYWRAASCGIAPVGCPLCSLSSEVCSDHTWQELQLDLVSAVVNVDAGNELWFRWYVPPEKGI